MRRRFLSIILVLALITASAISAFAADGASKDHENKDSFTVKKEYQAQKKEQIRSEYSTEELDAIDEVSKKIIKEDPQAKILGVDSVISNKAKFKFDTPPVIKDGRTLIPVRAITEGFGAQLTYDQESQLVTITKEDTVIQLTLGSTVAVVNGQEVQMDTKANIMSNRTYVPLRFVLETFKLSVNWDEDTETIEIDDETDTTEDPDESTTPEAVTVSE